MPSHPLWGHQRLVLLGHLCLGFPCWEVKQNIHVLLDLKRERLKNEDHIGNIWKHLNDYVSFVEIKANIPIAIYSTILLNKSTQYCQKVSLSNQLLEFFHQMRIVVKWFPFSTHYFFAKTPLMAILNFTNIQQHQFSLTICFNIKING